MKLLQLLIASPITIIFILNMLPMASVMATEGSTGRIDGTVTHRGRPVEFANLAIKGTSAGATTTLSGHFTIDKVPVGKQTVLVSMVGFKSREIVVPVTHGNPAIVNIELEETIINLEQVVITGTMREVSLKDSPVKMEVIRGDFFAKNASNNLIEAIGLVNGLDVSNDCSVCGTTGININGMESSNTAVLIDGMPIMGALASVYGLNGIPTEMIERIEVLKGPSSTLYGSEAVAGVINVITKNPADVSLFSLNSFVTGNAERNIDFALAPLQKGRVKTLLSGNIYAMENYMDNNEDGFADMVLTRPRISLFNRWTVERPQNRAMTLAAKFYHENRFGGTKNFLNHYTWKRDDPFRGNDSIYGESIFTNRFEFMGTYQLPVTVENIRLDFSYSYHDQDSWYAQDKYAANQEIIFGNMIWTKDLGARNELLAGLSARYQTYDDNTEIIPEKDIQFIPGVFVQNQYKIRQGITLLAGARLDHHKNHGAIFSPRFSASWKPGTFTTIRLNTGTGFRIVNVFSEDHAAYHGIREVVIENEIKPERSQNANLSLYQIFSLGRSILTLDMDVFYTHFTNKIEADYDADPTKLIYRNLDDNEYAVSRGTSASLQASFPFPLTISLGLTWQDVFAMELNEEGFAEKTARIKVPDLTGVYAISYYRSKWRTSVDLTGTYTSAMRMPLFDAPYSRPGRSEPFFVHNLQLNHTLKFNSSIYFGVKNLFNFTQGSPIINPQNPFDDTFDTSYVYGPLLGRRFLLGVRVQIN
jgi:outer membrane receptor for ferrienterochelin and colicins